MTQDRFRQAADIFLQARGLKRSEREEFLARACEGDSALRAEVDRLLTGDDQPMPFASLAEEIKGAQEQLSPTLVSTPDMGASLEPDLIGTRIGPYRILEKIGEGGFGVVYMAEQEHPVRRRVALKIIKAGMDTRAVITRFEAERQALAIMDHPGIAKVFDAGETPTGRPFFAMELVRGEPITTFCDKSALAPRERLALFQEVCNAVQHAHTKGVIHRDIKPTNVLVTVVDGKPVPKVIDFGIAKATSAQLTDRTLFTEFRQLVGTPEYMSPEQADMNSADIDTRSDVYSLGVLLYELLTGAPPFDARSLRKAALDEMRRIIREDEPPKPSTKIGELTGATEEGRSVARSRSTEIRALARTMRGELDWIVMRCLEKDRTRRYETAVGLAEDIGRFLAGQPVLAGPPTAAYRVRKFIARNRLGVATAVVVTLAGVVATSSLAYAYVRVSHERDAKQEALIEKDAEAARATRQAERATATNKVLKKILDGANINEQREGEVTFKDILDAAVAEVDANPGDPLVEASVRFSVAQAYSSLGHADKALPHMVRAHELYRKHSPEDPDTMSQWDALVHTMAMAGDLKGAMSQAKLLLSELDSWPEKGGPIRTGVLSHASLILRALGDGPGSIEMSKAAVDSARATKANDHDMGSVLSNWAIALQGAGRGAEAIPLLQEALTLTRRSRGARHHETATVLNNLAMACLTSGQVAQGEPLLREAYEIRTTVLPKDHPQAYEARNNLAWMYVQRGDFEVAAPLLREAVDLAQASMDKDDLLLATFRNNLGTTLGQIGKFEEARTQLAESIRVRELKLPPGHPHTAISKRNLGRMLCANGDVAGGMPLLEGALDSLRKAMPPNHRDIAAALQSLGQVHAEQGDAIKAIPLLEESLTARLTTLGPDSREVLECRTALSSAQRQVGKLDLALANAQTCVDLRRVALALPGAGKQWLSESLFVLALVHIDKKSPQLAQPLLAEALELWGESASKPWVSTQIRAWMGVATYEQSKSIEALNQAKSAFAELSAFKSIPPAELNELSKRVAALGSSEPAPR